MITRYLITLVVFLNLGLSGFVLAAIAARFVFPALSLEGQTLWLLGSAPLRPGDVLGAKYWVGAIPLTVLAVLLTGVTNALLGVSAGLAILSLVSVVGLSLAFTAQALAWGVVYPEFESENAAQIPTSVGGLLFMLGALASLPGREPREPFAWELGLALGATSMLCLLAGWFPYRAAVRRLGRLGGGS
jgi:ABC-2 type transport system permease protein